MRYPPDHKERTRQKIVETASRILRRDGIANTSIVPLMRELGLTQGAFYKSFTGRDHLVTEALTHAVTQTQEYAERWVESARNDGLEPIARIIDEYLSERHLDSREHSCIIAAVGPELWRQSDEIRQHSEVACEQMFAVVTEQLPVDRRQFGRPLYMLMAGVISCARLAGTRERQLICLAEGRAAARALAGLDE